MAAEIIQKSKEVTEQSETEKKLSQEKLVRLKTIKSKKAEKVEKKKNRKKKILLDPCRRIKKSKSTELERPNLLVCYKKGQ